LNRNAPAASWKMSLAQCIKPKRSQMYKFYNNLIVRSLGCIPESLRAVFIYRQSKLTKAIFMKIKVTAIILFIACLQVSAASIAQSVSLSERNSTLTSVFEKLRQQTGYDFLYTTSVLSGTHNVTVSLRNEPLEQALKKILNDQPLQFSVQDRSVVITRKRVAPVPEGLVHGVVYGANDQPLSGATLRIIGFRQSAATDDKGMYVIMDAPPNGMLVASYLGYKSDSIAIQGRNEINFHLKLSNQSLQEVVVVNTGYQQLNKERATGTFGKPDMKLFMDRSSSTDIVSRLEGLVPGVTVIPGFKGQQPDRYGIGTTQKSVIRGLSTVRNGSDPLYVVNGVQVENLSNINPDDIGDISVLKDAAAAAIWGARAANGVIVVTTKSGRASQKVKINYTGYLTYFGKPDFEYSRYMNSSQYIQTAKEIFNPQVFPWATLANATIAPHDLILYNQSRGLTTAAQANASLDSLSGIDNQQQIKDLWYRNAFLTNHTVSASGGSSVYNFYSSLSFTDNHSNEVGSDNKAYRMSFNQTVNPTKFIRFSLNTLLNNVVSKAARPISVGTSFLPYQLFQDNNGKNINLNYVQGLSAATRADYQQRSRLNLDYSPLDDLNRGYTKGNQLTINTTGNLEVKMWKGLSFNGTYGYQKSPGVNTQYDDISSYAMRKELLNFTVARTPDAVPVYYLPTTGGRFSKTVGDSYNWTVRNQLVYNTRLRADKDVLNVQIGQEAQEQYRSFSTTTLRGYDDQLKTYSLLDYNTLSQGIFGAIGSFRSVFTERPYRIDYERTRFKSYFGLLSYGVNDKYFFDASIRRDLSNLFASTSASQKKPAYSFGGKWLISREEFFKKQSLFDNLALRATYGITGNSPYLGAGTVFDVLSNVINTTYGNSLYVVTPQNNKLSWESTHTYNVGIDFGALSGRLNGSVDYYSKNTTDLIGRVNANPFTGYGTITGNVGNMTNRGIELNLRSVNIQSRSFNWMSNLVFSYNNNKLASYSDEDPTMLTDIYRLNAANVVGHSSPGLFAYRFAGLDNLGDPQIRLANGTVTKERDAANADDLVYMGTTLPKFNGGLSNTFKYNQVSLTANIVYSFGAVMRRDVNSFYTGRLSEYVSFSGGNLIEDFADRWKKPGDEASTNIPSYVASRGIDYSRRNTAYFTLADINVVSASYAKVRDITLSYDFTPKVLKTLRLENARIYAQTGNIMLWKANKYDIDPEYQNFTGGTRSIPPYKHPLTIGVNVTF
jgi:TonB-linked SusC/RagA family outer membrane protein